jgi:N-acetylneuraminic acid mutarotase
VTSLRSEHAVVWTGTEVLVWGGDVADGAAYNPATDRWRRLAASPVTLRTVASYGWSGRELIVYGGYGPPTAEDAPLAIEKRGAAYDPAADTWRPLATSPLEPRLLPGFTAGPGSLLVWGGQAFEPERVWRNGALYDADANSWTSTPALATSTSNNAEPRAVWTGEEFLVLHARNPGKPATFSVVSYRP